LIVPVEAGEADEGRFEQRMIASRLTITKLADVTVMTDPIVLEGPDRELRVALYRTDCICLFLGYGESGHATYEKESARFRKIFELSFVGQQESMQLIQKEFDLFIVAGAKTDVDYFELNGGPTGSSLAGVADRV
jgi:hypothetical protein